MPPYPRHPDGEQICAVPIAAITRLESIRSRLAMAGRAA